MLDQHCLICHSSGRSATSESRSQGGGAGNGNSLLDLLAQQRSCTKAGGATEQKSNRLMKGTSRGLQGIMRRSKPSSLGPKSGKQARLHDHGLGQTPKEPSSIPEGRTAPSNGVLVLGHDAQPQQILRPRPIAYASHHGYDHYDDGFGTWVRLVHRRIEIHHGFL